MSALPAPGAGMPLRALLRGVATGAPDLAVTGVEMDSRRVQPGDLFLACRGQAQHGLAFLAQAMERGAAAVAWEPAPGVAAPERIASVAVENLSARAGEIAARFFGDPSRRMFTVGITGTDGKTSTAHLAAQALDRLGHPCAYLGTLGYGRLDALRESSHTTPDPVKLQRMLAEFLAEGATAAAMEVSSHALDQDRIAGMKIDVAVLTNVGRDHLDYHGDIPSYAAAKHRLFKRPELKAAVFNRDDAYGRAWSAECPPRREDGSGRDCAAYGLDAPAPAGGRFVIGENLKLTAEGLALDVRSSWGPARLVARLLGRFNAYNLLAVLTVLLEKGVPIQDACAVLSHARTVPGRIEGFRGPRAAPLVVVDYAHTPQALEQILKAVRAHCAGRLWAVFGCGGDRDRGKRPLMGAAAAQFADCAIVTDDNPRSERPEAIVAEIVAGAPDRLTRVVHDRASAIATAVREAAADDVVVVAGKGHEDYQIYGKDVRAFSDRQFVAQLVGAELAP